MDITTRFSLGDKVDALVQRRVRVFEDCQRCEGSGSMYTADGVLVERCWTCGGDGHTSHMTSSNEWYVDQYAITISLVEVRVRAEQVTESYMCHETGVGSGTNWRGENLVPAGQGYIEVLRRNSNAQGGS